MSQTTTRPTNLETVPACLRVHEIASILGISRAHAYNLVSSDGFPCLTIGKRIVVPKSAFVRWMDENTASHGSQDKKA